LGVLRVLAEAEVPVEAVAGTSGGALVGALFASGRSLDLVEAEALQTSWSDLTSFAFSRRGLFGLRGLESRIRDLLKVDRFEDLSIPLRVVATDLDSGERVVITDGDLISALLASCAIPGVFLPVERDGRVLVDGGISCNVPVDVVRDMGCRVVMGVDATAGIQHLGKPFNLLQVVVQSIYSMSRHLTAHYLESADLVVAPEMKGVSWESLDQTARIIESGRQEMLHQLPLLMTLLRGGRVRRLASRLRWKRA
jgi:NTE family protein